MSAGSFTCSAAARNAREEDVDQRLVLGLALRPGLELGQRAGVLRLGGQHLPVQVQGPVLVEEPRLADHRQPGAEVEVEVPAGRAPAAVR